MNLKTICLLAFAVISSHSMAQKKQFTIDDLIPGGKTYRTTSYPQNKFYTWWGDVCVELDMEKCTYADNSNAKQKKAHVSLDYMNIETINDVLIQNGCRPIFHLYDVTFPYPEQTLALILTSTERALYDWAKKQIVWKSAIVDGDIDFNAKSKATAYSKGNDLYVETQDGVSHQVSTDGSLDIVYGKSVHRNEFGISKGTYWNPDGTLLAFYRMDQSMVSKYPQVNITPYDDSQVYEGKDSASLNSRCAILEPDPYPMAGETSHKVTVGIFNPATDKTIYLNAGDPTDRYFTNIAWSPDGSKLYLIELNRDQNHGSLDEYDATTGEKARTLFTESNDKYFEPTVPIQFLPWDNSKFIYLTRKDGYQHIYLYNKDGKLIKQLTKGVFEVQDVLGFNSVNNTIIYTSNEKAPLQCNVYSVDMKGKRTLLGNSTGCHYPELSASGSYVLDNYNSPLIARNIDVISTQTGKTANLLSAPDPWTAYDVPQIKVGTIKAADGVTDLYYRLILPTNFDSAKKYPAVVYVYGGPHAHNIDATRNWGARGWEIWMAQQGYVMFCLDNRGSENRGLAFEQATFRNLGVEEMRDQIKGVEYLKSLPYVDAERLGVHGWSFGGFMTTSLMTTYPDVFKAGVAGGPVIDWKFYEVMYGERYMDTPQSNPEGYKNTSLLGKADKLKGRLMIIYGGNDPVCVPQHTLSFIRACIDAGTYPDLFTYPGDGHNMSGSDRPHLYNIITRYFEDHLKK